MAGLGQYRPLRPLLIVGTGRCGSTMLHRLLALHPELGWLSTFNEVAPSQNWLSVFSRLYRLPVPVRVRDSKVFPKPFEAYRYWEHYLPGFSRRSRPLMADDVAPEAIPRVRRAVTTVLRLQGRPRLLIKVTGWSRIAYFDRIFPDARFLSLRRDPRAVASSWVKAGWLDVTSDPQGSSWEWGSVPGAYLDLYRELGGGPLLSVALKMRLDLDDIAANAALFPERFSEISYEDLISRPEPTLRSVCEFAGLAWTSAFARVVGTKRFHDSTQKWRAHLADEDAARITEFIERTERPAGSIPT